MQRVLSVVTFAVLSLAVAGCGTLTRGADASGARSLAMSGPPTDTEDRATPTASLDAAAVRADDVRATPGDDRASTVVAMADERIETPVTTDAAPVVGDANPPASAAAVPVASAASSVAPSAPYLFVQAKSKTGDDEYDVEDYDPWEKFNEKMFEFNRRLDRYILKPVAKAYDKVMPDDLQRMLANAFDNIQGIPRMVNSALQGKWDGAMREFGRLLLNSTVGVGGLFDVAKHEGIDKSREDFGQTLAFYGAGPGPYLVLPFMEPMTVRDGIGRGVDGVMDPLGWTVGLIPERLILKIVDVVNERSLNLELFQGFEETVIDMYSAVRHAYLERRRQLIKQ